MYLSKRDAAAYAGVSLPTIKRAIAAGQLRVVTIGSRPLVRTTRRWVDEWVRGES